MEFRRQEKEMRIMENDFTPVTPATFFRNRPSEDAGPIGIPIVRTPIKGKAGGIILSDDAVGCWTHFWQGRTRPCTDIACVLCADGNARRWHSWVVTKNASDKQLFIVEVPAAPALALAEWRDEHGTLRGWKIQLERLGGKANGRVRIAMAGPKAESAMLPACPDLPALLLKMWQIKSGPPAIDILDEPRVYNADGDEDENQMGVVA